RAATAAASFMSLLYKHVCKMPRSSAHATLPSRGAPFLPACIRDPLPELVGLKVPISRSPVQHVFRNAPVDGPDFTCATLDFDGGERNPIVQSLPALLAVPLADVEGLGPTLDLLFAEADRVRCGSRLLASRLF